MGLLFLVVGLVGLVLVGAIVRGFVLSILWSWFLVPLGVPEIGIAWAMGISMLVAMLTYENPKTEDGEIPAKLATLLIGPLVALFFAWIIHGFM